MAAKKCPFLKDECIEHNCNLYVQLLGTNPQTGEQRNDFGCTFQFLPILLVENARVNRETGAAVESFRNEMVKANQDTARMIGFVSPAPAERPAALPAGKKTKRKALPN